MIQVPEGGYVPVLSDQWIDNPAPAGASYWESVHEVAARLESDGCTCVSDIFIDACYEHDIHWRLGTTIYGDPITTKQANRRFRRVIQSRSRFGVLSPVSWVRFLGVSIGARFIHHNSK